jgi:GTP-binding protein
MYSWIVTEMKPVVAIIGRPNVGKSTLFNALARRNLAIVDNAPGVTRDRNYADVAWKDGACTLVDTGGFDPVAEDDLACLVREQASIAVEEADLIVFLMDGRDGLTSGDLDIAAILQKSAKPVLYAVNKVESSAVEDSIVEFYRLGAEKIIAVSGKTRQGLAELADEICSRIPAITPAPFDSNEIVVSILGRPNVGKSSLINRILGLNRLMVSPQPGTTRDPVDSVIRYKHATIRFIDTAGIRRKSRIGYTIERYCVFKALKCIDRSMICVLVLDATTGVQAQDASLAAEIFERHRASIIVVNKWDLVEKDTRTHDRFAGEVRAGLSFIDFAPLLVVSALTGQRVRHILDSIIDLAAASTTRIPTPAFNRELREISASHPPPRGRGRPPKVYYGTQVEVGPPTFRIFTNRPEAFPIPYRRFLERSIRERFGMGSVPIYLQFAKRTGKEK